jgi:hypothetical protein
MANPRDPKFEIRQKFIGSLSTAISISIRDITILIVDAVTKMLYELIAIVSLSNHP